MDKINFKNSETDEFFELNFCNNNCFKDFNINYLNKVENKCLENCFDKVKEAKNFYDLKIQKIIMKMIKNKISNT